MRRAVFGGSFDPVHRGHLAMAHAILDADLADYVHVIPAWRSPFKDKVSAAAVDRLAMVELAFGNHENIVVDPMEISKGAPSYTVDSLIELHKQFPDDALFLVIGADNIPGLSGWSRVNQLADLAELIVLGRHKEPINLELLEKLGFPKSRVSTLPNFDYPVSSTRVRENLLAGHYPEEYLSPEVLAYIKSHALYRNS
jgi:nicotinate-nucleotide adenylyltransferase